MSAINKENWSVKPIVDSEIDLLLKIGQYYCA